MTSDEAGKPSGAQQARSEAKPSEGGPPRSRGEAEGRSHGKGVPADTRRALDEAARHARAAAAEAALALRALVDAAALFTTGVPADSHALLGGAAQWLDSLARGASPETSADLALTQALAGALDAEIARWEARAAQDPDARAVLRAFLGVRELLWELGVRSSAASEPAPRAREKATARRKRVERVPVQG